MEDKYLFRTLIVDKGQTPLRVDRFLQDKLEKVSRSRIQKAIKSQHVIIKAKPIKANYKVQPEDVINIYLEEESRLGGPVKPEKIELNILYEDDDLMIVNKASGLVVHPGVGNHNGTLVNGLVYHIQNNELPVMSGNLGDRPGLVHRIDKYTSGLLVVAKTETAMTHLSKQFFDHTIDRTYYAIVWGNFEENLGTVEAHIGRSEKDRLKMIVYPEGLVGKHAITHYEVLEDLYYVSLVKCKLETGRTHQIRVHMNYLGHPVFSDERYGGDKVVKGTVFNKYKQFVNNCFNLCPRQALHAKSLGFEHPRTKKWMEFNSDLPNDMTLLLDKWRNYLDNRKRGE